MKLDKHETHDRYEYFIADQSDLVAQGAQECLYENEYSLILQDHSSYIYIFGHARTHDDGVTKRLIWQPRLTKPLAQPNSYLFRAESHTDILEICWILPPKETWDQFKKGNIVYSDMVAWSIDQYINHRKEMEKPEKDDVTEQKFNEIMRQVKADIKDRNILFF